MRIDFYILREWVKVFCLTVLAVLGILVVDDIQDDLRDLLSYGASAREVLIYYLVLIPRFLPVILPVSILVSVLFVLGQFHKNMEITAMRASGLSMFRISRSLWAMGILMTCLMFYLNARLVPWSTETSRELWNNHRYANLLQEESGDSSVGMLYNLTFYNNREKRMWFLNRFSELEFRAYGITLSELSDEGIEQRRIVANEGFYDDHQSRWVLQNGRMIEFSADGGDPIRSLAFDTRQLENASEDPQLMKYLEKKPEDLSLNELGSVLYYMRTSEDPRIARYIVSYYDRLFSPLSCLVVLGLAIPFAVSGVRTNPFVGVSKAMGWFVLYYLLVSVGHLLGNNGLYPIGAAAFPHLTALSLLALYQIKTRIP